MLTPRFSSVYRVDWVLSLLWHSMNLFNILRLLSLLFHWRLHCITEKRTKKRFWHVLSTPKIDQFAYMSAIGRLRRDNHPSVKLLINVVIKVVIWCKEVFWNVIKIELGDGEGLTLLDFSARDDSNCQCQVESVYLIKVQLGRKMVMTMTHKRRREKREDV